MKTLGFQLGIKYNGTYQVTLDFLVLLPAILGTIPIPLAVVQVLGAAATHVPDTHLLLPRLLGLWGFTVNSETATCSSDISFKEFLLAFQTFAIVLPGFFSRACHALAEEFLPLLLHDLILSQTLVAILHHLLPRR